MRRIAVANLKGGTAKSTTATCLAVALARRGHRVLCVDTDAQANATWTLLGGQGAEPPTLAAVLTRQASAEEAIRPTATLGLDLLPADASLGGVNVALAQELARDTRLRSALAPLDGDYDFAIIDTPPTLSTLLVNALVAAHEVITPTDAGMYSTLGLVQLQEMLEEVREAYGNDRLHLAGLLLTRVARNSVARDVEASLRSSFGDRVFKATIPLTVQVEAAHTRAETIMTFAPKSPAALAYESLVDEVLSDGRHTEDGSGGASERVAGADAEAGRRGRRAG